MFAAFGWVAFVVLVSIVYRRSRGKLIIPQLPPGAIFSERRASAPFAANCLLVAVTKTTLSVVPRFPFNLMFLPEVYRLEHEIPLASIVSVETPKSILGSNVIVTHGANARKVRLKVRQPLALASAIRQSKAMSVN
jgi:hypothetical protein